MDTSCFIFPILKNIQGPRILLPLLKFLLHFSETFLEIVTITLTCLRSPVNLKILTKLGEPFSWDYISFCCSVELSTLVSDSSSL